MVLSGCGFVQNIAPPSLSRDRRIKMEQATTTPIYYFGLDPLVCDLLISLYGTFILVSCSDSKLLAKGIMEVVIEQLPRFHVRFWLSHIFVFIVLMS